MSSSEYMSLSATQRSVESYSRGYPVPLLMRTTRYITQGMVKMAPPGRIRCDCSDPTLPQGTKWEHKDSACPPGAPILVFHLPRTQGRLFHPYAHPGSPIPATTRSGDQGHLETKAATGKSWSLTWVTLHPFLCLIPPPRTSPCFPKSVVPSCSPGSGSHKALITLRSSCLNAGHQHEAPETWGSIRGILGTLKGGMKMTWWG